MNPVSAKSPMRVALAAGLFGLFGFATGAADAAVRIDGQVQAGGGPVANSTVTLWAGSVGEPKQLAQARTADDGSFALGTDECESASEFDPSFLRQFNELPRRSAFGPHAE